jgi:hypothetical protein
MSACDRARVAVKPDGKNAFVTNFGPFTSLSEAINAVR